MDIAELQAENARLEAWADKQYMIIEGLRMEIRDYEKTVQALRKKLDKVVEWEKRHRAAFNKDFGSDRPHIAALKRSAEFARLHIELQEILGGKE